MNDNRNVTRSAKATRSIKQSAMTRAVRSVLAASALTLALGATSGTATAAAHRIPVAHALQLQRAAIDFAPVADPSLVPGGLGGIATPPAPVMSLVSGWGGYYPGSVSANNSNVLHNVYSNVDDAAGSYFGAAGSVTFSSGSAATDIGRTGGAFNAYGVLLVAGTGATANIDGTAQGWAYGSGDAFGVGVVANTGDAAVNVGATGDVYAYAFSGDATGVTAVSLGGDASVDNAGSVSTYSFLGDATGINAVSVNGNASVDNSNYVGAYAYLGDATGIYAAAYGNVDVTNSGTVQVYAWDYAVGINAYSAGGNVSVTNSDTVDVESGNDVAIGIAAVANTTGTAGVTNSDYIHVVSNIVAAGINAYSAAGDVTVTNAATGDIEVYGYIRAYGVRATGGGNVTVTNDGQINAYSNYYADGIFASGAGDVTVTNTGDIYAYTHDGGLYTTHATGISATSADGTVTVTNSGSVEGHAWQFGDGTGIVAASTNGDVSVTNTATGDVQAYSWAGNAIGINAGSTNGDVTVQNDGAIDTESHWFNGIGVYAASGTGDVTINNTGSARGYTSNGTYGNAVGLWGVSNGGDVTITNDGHAEGFAYLYGNGIGMLANAYGDATITNSATGTVYAYVFSDTAIGMYAYGGTAATATNNGYVGAVGSVGLAYGVAAISGGDASVVNNGDVYVNGKYGSAALYAAGADAVASNSATGYLHAVSKYGNAIGAQAYSAGGSATTTNAGLINAETTKYGGLAIGMYANAPGGTATAVNSGEIHADALYTAAPYGPGVGMAVGIFAYGDDVSVTNTATGSVYVRGYGWAAGIEAGGIADSTVGVTNAGLIQVASVDTAFGVYAYGDNVTVTNSGDIGATPYVAGSFNDAGIVGIAGTATGVYAYGYYNATVTNAATGAINVYGYTSAMGASAKTNKDEALVVNAGSITTYSPDTSVGAQAYAIAGDALVINQQGGTITALSPTGMGVGAVAVSDQVASLVDNSGTITASGLVTYGAISAGYTYGGVVNSGHVVSMGDAIAAGAFATSSGLGSLAYVSNTNSVYSHAGLSAGMSIAASANNTNTGNAVVLNSATGTINATGGILAIGVSAHATDGDVTVTNAGAIHAQAYGSPGAVAIAVAMSGTAGTNTLNNLAGGVVQAYGSNTYAYAVTGDDGVDVINNAGTITGDVLTYAGDDAFNNLAGGIWNVAGTMQTDFGDDNDSLSNSGTIWITNGSIGFGNGDDTATNNANGLINLSNGLIHMDAGINTFTNAGKINVLGNVGNTIDAGVDGTVFNNGLIEMNTGFANEALTVASTFGGTTGHLSIDVKQVGLTADHLFVNGDVLANTKQTVDINLDPVFPLTAHTSIPFAWVTGTSAAGNFVPGTIYGYNWPLNFIDLGYTIGSNINAANTADDVFSVNLDVNGLNDTGAIAALTAQGAANFMNTQMGTFRQRLGVNPYGDAGKVMSAYVRYYSTSGDVTPGHLANNFGQGGHFNFDQSTWGYEVGVNANLMSNLHVGVVLGNADSRQRLNDGGVGTNRMDGMTFGGYMTWYVPSGWYLDVTARKMAADVKSTSVAGTLTNRIHTNSVSLEGGYEFKVGNINIVPQLQYTWTQVDELERPYHGQYVDMSLGGGHYNRGRIGVDFNTQIESGDFRWTPYGSLNWVHNSRGTSDYVISNSYSSFSGSTWVSGSAVLAEFGVGIEKGGWGVTLGGNWTDGGKFDSMFGGQVNVRYSW